MSRNQSDDQPQSRKTLRERAEEMSRTSRTDVAGMTTEEVQRLVYELQIHQMELLLQNEELRDAQVELAESRDRFSDLYEFAPVGYVTIDQNGKILEANLKVTTMLGVERQVLLRTPITRFVDRKSQDAFHLHRQAVLANGTAQACELQMKRANGTHLTARLESVPFDAAGDRRCRTALIDLTAERRLWQQLQQSEYRYRRLTSAVADYVYRVEVSEGRVVGTFHGVNCGAMTGYSPEEFAANPWLWIAMVPPEDRALVEQHAAYALTAQVSAAIEHRILRKDGQLRWVVNTVSPELDEAGQLLAYDGLLHDITDRKHAEAELKQLSENLEGRVASQTSEIRLLAEAVSHLAEGVVITGDDVDWPGPIIQFVNEAMCNITGYRADELVGQTPRVLQGRGIDLATLQCLKAELAAGRSYLCEVVNYRKDGTPYDAELFITPLIDSAGNRTNFVSIHRDITVRKQSERALKQSEERLRAILRTAADAIITIDRNGAIVDVNVATEQMFGYGRFELIGENVKILMPAPYCDKHDGFIARYIQTGEARIIGSGREVVGRRKDDSVFPVWVAVSEVDHLDLFTGIIRDLSRIKELEKRLLEISADEQRRIGQELHDGTGQELTGLSLFAGTLVQAVHTASPLNVDGIKTWRLDDIQFQRLEKAATRLSQGLTLANRHVAELSRGIMPVQVDAEGLRSALTELAAQTNANDDVVCQFVSVGSIHILDNTAATHLYRIAQEALNNALRHGQANQVSISLSQKDDRVILEIIDNGIGFDPAERRRTGTGKKGMGLRIMEYRAGVIGGVFRVERNPSGGMRVSCEIQQYGGGGG